MTGQWPKYFSKNSRIHNVSAVSLHQGSTQTERRTDIQMDTQTKRDRETGTLTDREAALYMAAGSGRRPGTEGGREGGRERGREGERKREAIPGCDVCRFAGQTWSPGRRNRGEERWGSVLEASGARSQRKRLTPF